MWDKTIMNIKKYMITKCTNAKFQLKSITHINTILNIHKYVQKRKKEKKKEKREELEQSYQVRYYMHLNYA